jgi:excisionase family DNA binding protein
VVGSVECARSSELEARWLRAAWRRRSVGEVPRCVRGVAVGKLRGRFGLLEVYGYMNTTRSTTKPSAVQLDGPLLRPDEAARLLAVKTNWIYEAVRDGRLPCLRLGRHIRFTRAMLEQWLEEGAGS